MEHEERNRTISVKILEEITDINAFLEDVPEDALLTDKLRQKAIVMSLINIGELSKAFTDAYLSSMKEIPWKSIRGFRNIAAHQYGVIDFLDVLKTVQEDLPLLRHCLEKQIQREDK